MNLLLFWLSEVLKPLTKGNGDDDDVNRSTEKDVNGLSDDINRSAGHSIILRPNDPRFVHVFEVLSPKDGDVLKVGIINGVIGTATVEWVKKTVPAIGNGMTEKTIPALVDAVANDNSTVKRKESFGKIKDAPMFCFVESIESTGLTHSLPYNYHPDSAKLICKKVGSKYGKREMEFDVESFTSQASRSSTGVEPMSKRLKSSDETMSKRLKSSDETTASPSEETHGAPGESGTSGTATTPKSLKRLHFFLQELRLNLQFDPSTTSISSSSLDYHKFKGERLPQDKELVGTIFDYDVLSDVSPCQSGIADESPGDSMSLPEIDLILAIPRPKVWERLFQAIALFNVRRLFLLGSPAKVENGYFDNKKLGKETVEQNFIEGLQQASWKTRLPIVRVLPKLDLKSAVESVEGSLSLCVVGCSDEHYSRQSKCYDYQIVAHPYNAKKMRDIIHKPQTSPGTITKAPQILLAVGPEGGWTDDEMNTLKNFSPISLGPRIYKTYDAFVALMAMLYQEFE